MTFLWEGDAILGMTSSPLTMVLDSESKGPSSWCQACWASTSAVTRLFGMIGLPSASRGRAMNAGRSWRDGGDVPARVAARVRSLEAEVMATIRPYET